MPLKTPENMANISVLIRAAALSEFNPAAAELLIQLEATETSSQVLAALEAYDTTVNED